MRAATYRLAVGAALLCAGWAAMAQTPPSAQDFATAFRNGDYERFKSMIANDQMGMLDRAGNVTALSRDDLVERLRACTLNHVYEAGKNFQTLSGADWICRDRPVAGEPCEAVAYGLNLFPMGDRFRVRVYLTSMPDSVACPNRGPAAPARPLRTSN